MRYAVESMAYLISGLLLSYASVRLTVRSRNRGRR